MKFKLIAAAAMLAVTGSSFAAIQDATTGNGELIANFRLYSADNDNNGGNNDISGLFDLGVNLTDFLARNGQVGYTQTWSLTAANYGNAWNTLLAFDPARLASIEFNVIALDNTNANTAGGSRYLTTADVATYPALSNLNLNNFQNMNTLIVANQGRGTHTAQTHGASTATSGDAQNTYFGKVANGTLDGDTWATQTTADTTKSLATAQNFWYVTTSSTSNTAQATKTAFGVDLNNNGAIGAGEFGEWSVNLAAGTISYANPVPEAETWAMLVAGLGLVGAIARRRRHRAA